MSCLQARNPGWFERKLTPPSPRQSKHEVRVPLSGVPQYGLPHPQKQTHPSSVKTASLGLARGRRVVLFDAFGHGDSLKRLSFIRPFGDQEAWMGRVVWLDSNTALGPQSCLATMAMGWFSSRMSNMYKLRHCRHVFVSLVCFCLNEGSRSRMFCLQAKAAIPTSGSKGGGAQVSHTYGYQSGSYGVINEHGAGPKYDWMRQWIPLGWCLKMCVLRNF